MAFLSVHLISCTNRVLLFTESAKLSVLCLDAQTYVQDHESSNSLKSVFCIAELFYLKMLETSLMWASFSLNFAQTIIL